ncbi:MAG: hypothetical protein M1818_002757 [Claussenomyces sp. TS43310]|nr:MAG: hypothetical protein M1818_002757 [Claussenomyces sp. TS43310]
MSNHVTPTGLVGFGKQANCTLDLCSAEYSVFHYVPSLAANSVFLALFVASGLIHLYQGVRSKQWFYMSAAVLGCVTEVIGYAGRIELHKNPFDFTDFLIQIVCLTIGPAFFSASIYFTLTKIVNALGPEHSRFNAKWYYWGFIPCDVLSIVLQAAGGGLSSGGKGNNGVDVSLAGLAFQVFTLCVFVILVADYMLRWKRNGTTALTIRFKLFATLLSLAIIFILARSAYRIDELSDGYNGSIFHDQTSFIVLEGVLISIATFLLNLTHPSYTFDEQGQLIGGHFHKEISPSRSSV